MTIPLPPKFDADAGAEDEYLTPPIWVAMNPPPIFERPGMKRTASEISSWGGDEEDESTTSSEQPDQPEQKDEPDSDMVWFAPFKKLMI